MGYRRSVVVYRPPFLKTIKQNIVKPAARKHNTFINTPKMYSACVEHGVKITEFNINSYRLTKYGCATVDYFPSTCRLFYHETQMWSETENITNFIKSFFGLTKSSREALSESKNENEKLLGALVSKYGISVTETQGAVLRLSKWGFYHVDYNTRTNTVVMDDKEGKQPVENLENLIRFQFDGAYRKQLGLAN